MVFRVWWVSICRFKGSCELEGCLLCDYLVGLRKPDWLVFESFVCIKGRNRGGFFRRWWWCKLLYGSGTWMASWVCLQQIQGTNLELYDNHICGSYGSCLVMKRGSACWSSWCEGLVSENVRERSYHENEHVEVLCGRV
jgi:hypothetical protein